MLRDANEKLQSKLDELQGRYAGLALSKTDLSAQLLMTEEEKLRVSLDAKLITSYYRWWANLTPNLKFFVSKTLIKSKIPKSCNNKACIG